MYTADKPTFTMSILKNDKQELTDNQPPIAHSNHFSSKFLGELLKTKNTCR